MKGCRATPQPVFFYDLGSPECYLVAERIASATRVPIEWEPVFATDLRAGSDAIDRDRVERVAARQGLQPLRWPPSWPPDTRRAMLAATYAKQIGRGIAFSLAAFRQAFAGGRDLSGEETILIAGAACEMHPAALITGIGLRSVAAGLDRATARARTGGVIGLPAIATGREVLCGEVALHWALEASR